jgi:hypothetical protein
MGRTIEIYEICHSTMIADRTSRVSLINSGMLTPVTSSTSSPLHHVRSGRHWRAQTRVRGDSCLPITQVQANDVSPGWPARPKSGHHCPGIVVFLPTLQCKAGLNCRDKPFSGLVKTAFQRVRTFPRDSQILVSKKKNTRLLLKTT